MDRPNGRSMSCRIELPGHDDELAWLCVSHDCHRGESFERAKGFPLARLYYDAVALFGGRGVTQRNVRRL